MPVTKYGLTKGKRARFFHPGAFGVMCSGVVQKVYDDRTVLVRFDEPYPKTTKYTFRVPAEHL